MHAIELDTTVTFKLKPAADGKPRSVTVEAGELVELQARVWAEAQPDASGNKILGWPAIEGAVTEFVKASNPTIELTRWEARALWDAIAVAWEKKRASWRGDTAPGPTSPPSSDPMYSD